MCLTLYRVQAGPAGCLGWGDGYGWLRGVEPDLFYTGSYHSDFYGTITVVSRDGALHVIMPPKPTDYPLEHWDGNLFALFPVGENALGISAATFAPGQDNDRAATLTLEYYNNAQYPDGTKVGIFNRQ
jgi:Domain of unknown function (DUF3471)